MKNGGNNHSHFITLEGCEGVGKSTALSFIQQFLSEKKIPCLFTREPGGTKVGEAIRSVLLHHQEAVIFPDTELLLMFAARAQHIAEVIKPALSEGKTVVSDRFTDASFAYQGGGRGIASSRLQTLSDWVQGDLEPHLTLLLDAPIEIGLDRMNRRGEKDRIEKEAADFFQRVRDAYLARAKQFPKRFVVIDASQSLEGVQAQIAEALQRRVMGGERE